MANFAILRVAKIKTIGALSASAQHNFRERETKNADPARTLLNEIEGAKSAKELVQATSDLLPKKRRKDAVIGLEYLITASPEHFGADWEKGQDWGQAYFKDAIAWLEKRHGAENIVCKTVHLDESTPHLAAFVVPKTADGRLSAKDFVGGRAILSKMQTSFANEVGLKHGLVRGVERSNAVHQDNAQIKTMTAERLALRKQVKELEAEIERLTKRVASGDSDLAAAAAKLVTTQAQESARVVAGMLGLEQMNNALAKAEATAKAEAQGRAQAEAVTRSAVHGREQSEAGLSEAQESLGQAEARLQETGEKLAKVQRKFEYQQKLNIDNMKVINALEAEKRGRINTELTPAAPKQEPKQEPVIAPEGVALANDGLSVGKILEVKNGYIVQDVGRGVKKAHRFDELGLSKEPELGDMLEINRRGGRVTGALNKGRGGISGVTR